MQAWSRGYAQFVSSLEQLQWFLGFLFVTEALCAVKATSVFLLSPSAAQPPVSVSFSALIDDKQGDQNAISRPPRTGVSTAVTAFLFCREYLFMVLPRLFHFFQSLYQCGRRLRAPPSLYPRTTAPPPCTVPLLIKHPPPPPVSLPVCLAGGSDSQGPHCVVLSWREKGHIISILRLCLLFFRSHNSLQALARSGACTFVC